MVKSSETGYTIVLAVQDLVQRTRSEYLPLSLGCLDNSKYAPVFSIPKPQTTVEAAIAALIVRNAVDFDVEYHDRTELVV